jgi:hypothetical protein
VRRLLARDPVGRPPAFLVGVAAAAPIAALTLWLVRGTTRGPGARGVEQAAAAPSSATALRDGEFRVALSATGAVSGLPSLPPDLRDGVVAVLRGALPPRNDLAGLRAATSPLLGSQSGRGGFGPLSPVGTRVSSDRPAFRWRTHPEALTYEVAVFDADLRKHAESGPVTGTTWTPARALPRGRVYLWQVSASVNSRRLTAPAPPAPEARFEVASSDAVREVENVRAAAPSSHLVGLVALLRAGFLEEAEAELEALALENPASPTIARLRDRLEAAATPSDSSR